MQYSDLSDQTIAKDFVRSRGMGTDRNAQALVSRVTDYLRDVHLEHRNAFDVALAANQLDSERARPEPAPIPAPSPEALAFSDDIRQGIGDPRPPSAEELRAMSFEQYIDNRSEIHAQHGIQRRVDQGIFGPVR